ncbi:hypothetical protein Y695_02241 [Hydrogenophaga sp. T4]|nr:hypothetical protein Y695_02241 [Hydrogenophaga sp. T4]
MLELRPHFPLADLLRAAELARSSFYYQLKVIRTGDKRCDLKAKIREIFNRHKGRYGYRRCRRRSKFEPPCRLNIEPGVEADFCGVGCG